MLIQQLFQGVRVGGIAPGGLFAVGQIQLLKQHLAQLLGAVEVEAPDAGELVHLLLQLLRLLGKPRSQSGKHLAVHLETRLLHIKEHVQQRHFHLVHQAEHALLLELLFLRPCQGQHPRRVLPGKIGQGVGFFLGIAQVRPQHGIPGELGQGQPPVG